ncbi:uncharacterized protein si:dkey-250k15.4 isoform X2 [Dunckerocampus dactyliophorus]|uniref:uncharacterized protein si:dkey-250k15.4 isoform X2 n=1 Tax=Dunckerocampus dactyliophorus TaxID=161453 RepID=UPI002405B4C6|nr:uncharacterized protein si:dkey-250k15.4 isoform X2 [Dunckerocampus dactyliophorus]
MNHMDGKSACKCNTKHKMKRLKSRKERSQLRGGGKEPSKAKPHQHHCHNHGSQDVAHLNSCRHVRCCTPRRECSGMALPTQEPSIITTARLIGHHGLFNHEVKSIDIERLLLEQKKRVYSEADAHKKKKKAASMSHNPPLNGVEDDPFEKGDQCEKEMLQCISQGPDITPGQQQRLSSASGESSKAHKNGGNTQPTCQGPKEKTPHHMVASEEHTPRNLGPPDRQPPVPSISPSPRWPHSLVTVETASDAQREDLLSKSISLLGQRLCATLCFPFMKKRDLVAESREVLLRTLQEAHGPHLQQNLLHMRTRCSFQLGWEGVTQKAACKDEQRLWSPDKYSPPFQINSIVRSCFATEGATALETPRRKHFPWQLSPQPSEKADGWLTTPMDTSVHLLEDLFRPSWSPDFSMDFDSSTASSSHHLFGTPAAWRAKSSPPQHFHFDQPRDKLLSAFGPFEDGFTDERRCHRSCRDLTASSVSAPH